ncbi:hypothetical protein V1Y59_07960 [Gordonia sp. PKS22-38]|uniref:Uncharacterized protein n=1 Tax=Gordonia prachuapensis TaxID=3115651 RepID=A0ABU7MRQ1_9ACTN|nr:hypothetical protein [Gordonia sp. PKS22-38]
MELRGFCAVRAAAAVPRGLFAGTGFGGGTDFFGATADGPNPVVVTASAEDGGLGPSSSTGTPTACAAFSPCSTVSSAGSSACISWRASWIRRLPGARNRPRRSASTALLPAAR